MQDINISDINKITYDEYKLKSDDVLKIDILTDESSDISFSEINNVSSNSRNREALIFEGYFIDSEGQIDYPSIGKMKVAGLTILEVKKMIRDKLIINQILTNPTVDIKLVNSFFTILGEVNAPGRYNFVTNNMDLLQAIGLAGDLTIDAVRSDVKIIRYTDKNKSISSVDLTRADFLSGSGFQIFPGDLIVVNPSNKKVKQAGFINDPSRLTSLISFLLSTYLVITR